MKPQSNLTVNYPSMPELTARGMILGALITVIFTASNVILGLKSRSDVLLVHSGCSHLHGNPAHVQRFQHFGK